MPLLPDISKSGRGPNSEIECGGLATLCPIHLGVNIDDLSDHAKGSPTIDEETLVPIKYLAPIFLDTALIYRFKMKDSEYHDVHLPMPEMFDQGMKGR